MAFAIEILNYLTSHEVSPVDLPRFIQQLGDATPESCLPEHGTVFSLDLSPHGPTLAAAHPQPPGTKGNERLPQGNAPCASLSFIRKQKNLSRSFPADFPVISLARLSRGLSHLQQRLGTQMSGRETRTIVIGPNLGVGTLPPSKEDGEVGGLPQASSVQWGGLSTVRAQWYLAGTATLPTTRPSQHPSPCSLGVSLPTCLPRWTVSTVGSIYPVSVSPVPRTGPGTQ